MSAMRSSADETMCQKAFLLHAINTYRASTINPDIGDDLEG